MRLSHWLVPIALLAGPQCSNGLSPRDFPVVTTVSRAAFRAGETLEITVEVTNQTGSEQKINANQCPPKFMVLRADGIVVGPGSYVCSLALITETLLPGAKATFAFKWSGEASNPTNLAETTFLPPGAYRVQGFAAVAGVGRVDGSIIDVIIQP
jgi:hypothetical protein